MELNKDYEFEIWGTEIAHLRMHGELSTTKLHKESGVELNVKLSLETVTRDFSSINLVQAKDEVIAEYASSLLGKLEIDFGVNYEEWFGCVNHVEADTYTHELTVILLSVSPVAATSTFKKPDDDDMLELIMTFQVFIDKFSKKGVNSLPG